MTYISVSFFALVIILAVVYYLVPLKARNKVLLLGSIAFCAFVSLKSLPVIVLTAFLTFALGKFLEKHARLWVLAVSEVLVLSPWIIYKVLSYVPNKSAANTVMLVGISFYSLEMYAYLRRIYKGEIKPEKSFWRFLSWAMYFPKLVQGPISDFEFMERELVPGHEFDEDKFAKGFTNILCGFFLKLVIADKAGVFVDSVFGNIRYYGGLVILAAGVLYSIQLYADFYGCVLICIGTSRLFGVELVNNFMRPYMSVSFKDFWSRWHISLSNWLSQNVYIPLGGSRKGKLRKYVNFLITFLVSGFWHGSGLNYIVWGLYHGVLRIIEDVTGLTGPKKIQGFKIPRRVSVFVLAMLGWIMFRASSLSDGLYAFKAICINPDMSGFVHMTLINDLYGIKEFAILIFSIAALWISEVLLERNVDLYAKFAGLKFPVRLIGYLVFTMFIVAFGTYGAGYNAADFIYGGF